MATKAATIAPALSKNAIPVQRPEGDKVKPSSKKLESKATEPKLAKSKPPAPLAPDSEIVFTLRTPVLVTDLITGEVPHDDDAPADESPKDAAQAGLGDPIAIDFRTADAELRLWKSKDTYAFETAIDVSRVAQQTLLDTDEHGIAKKDSLALSGRPYIRYFPTGKPPVTVDVHCTKKQCRALWPQVPFKEHKAQSFKIEANIRGLIGRHWDVAYNGYIDSRGTGLFRFPEAASFPKRTSLFNLAYTVPDEAELAPIAQAPNRALTSIEEWTLSSTGPDSTGFRRIRHFGRLELLEGDLILENVSGASLEKRPIREGSVLWVRPGQVLRLTHPGAAAQSTPTRLMRMEFSTPG